jgi:tRNA(fMet)-specific endonuclease VapC
MSLYALDTDILSLLQKGHATVVKNVSAHPPQDVAITVHSVEEQLSGWYTLIRQAKQDDKIVRGYQELSHCVRSLVRLTILDYNLLSLHRFKTLRQLKLNIRNPDLRIAAVALEAKAILVTRNTVDFKKIPGLIIEDWSQ